MAEASARRQRPLQKASDAVVRFRAFDTARFPLGEDRELVYSPLTRAARVIPSFCAVLRGCPQLCYPRRAFGPPLPGVELVNLEQRGMVREQLNALCAAGLLVSADDLVAAGVSAKETEEPPAIAMLGVPAPTGPIPSTLPGQLHGSRSPAWPPLRLRGCG